MVDKTASAESAASTLTGAEFWAAVQAGGDVKITVTQIAAAMLLLVGDVDTSLAANSDLKFATQKAVKAFIAATATGFQWKATVQAQTTAALPANTYANGTLGVGATLTGNSNGALPAQDGVTLSVNDRLAVVNESNGSHDGLYTLTQVGTGGTPYILTRAIDADTAAELLNATWFVAAGSTQARQKWTCNTPATITVGTTALTFALVDTGGGDASSSATSSVDNELALYSGVTGKLLKRASGSGYPLLTSGVLSMLTLAQIIANLQGDGTVGGTVGFRNIPKSRSVSTDTTITAADSGQFIEHPASDATGRTWTVPANASLALPVGFCTTYINRSGAGSLSIPIGGSDILRIMPGGSAGTRALASPGLVTLLKVDTTEWWASGPGLA